MEKMTGVSLRDPSELETVHLGFDNAISLVRRIESLIGPLVGANSAADDKPSPSPTSGTIPALAKRASYVSGEIIKAHTLLDDLMVMTTVGAATPTEAGR